MCFEGNEEVEEERRQRWARRDLSRLVVHTSAKTYTFFIVEGVHSAALNLVYNCSNFNVLKAMQVRPCAATRPRATLRRTFTDVAVVVVPQKRNYA